MSGGSMNYIGTRLLSETFREHTPERMAFAKHLALVAEALTRIEWVDRGAARPDLHQGHHARLRSARLLAPVLLRGPRAGRQAIRRGVRLTMRKGPEGPCLVLGDAADQLATGPSGCAAFQASTAAALVLSVWISPSLKRTVPTSTNASSCGG